MKTVQSTVLDIRQNKSETTHRQNLMNEQEIKLRNSSKLAVYAAFESDIVIEQYLGFPTPKKFLVIMTRFRTSSHTLEIEVGRHKVTLLSQHICEYCELCGSTCIVDEFHLVLNCPMYSEIKQCYLSEYLRSKLIIIITCSFRSWKKSYSKKKTYNKLCHISKKMFKKKDLYAFKISRFQNSKKIH